MAIIVDGKQVAGAIPGLSAYRSAQLGGYTGTEEEFYAALGGIGYTGLQLVLLWENASPTSDFAAQTVSLDGAGYDKYMVIFANQTTSTDVLPALVMDIGDIGCICNANGASGVTAGNLFVVKRHITATTETGITFDSGYLSQSAGAFAQNDQGCIPYKIYGIKGVTTNV